MQKSCIMSVFFEVPVKSNLMNGFLPIKRKNPASYYQKKVRYVSFFEVSANSIFRMKPLPSGLVTAAPVCLIKQ